ncbi:hypothetical protein CBR_g11131 [Chara braunii]|uniref:Uncharacterized protein n=1 Tax=Chara braunii TaxID=69332 RepID=A0A388KQ74_CHABU|nr:hypothetical protein CBR_g11131 [Chara braunii]|eukprot:GBG72199.1 hypothetical protein CBR_g11131 [Chara braunii]
MSKLYRDKLWALDRVGGTHEAGCGAIVFLTEDGGLNRYCCGGIMKSEGDKATTEKGKVDDRELRKFHLTSVYDEQGTDWVDADKKVSLDLALCKGYGQRAFGKKPFEAKGGGTEFRIVHSVDFLNKTNIYRKSGQYPKVDAGCQFTGPLVPYDTPVQGVADILKSCGEARQVPSTSQQHSDVAQKVITYIRRSGAGSSDKAEKRKQLATTPPQLQGPAATAGTSRSRQTDLQAVDQRSEEQTETEEDVVFRGRDVGSLEDSRHGGAGGDSEGNETLGEAANKRKKGTRFRKTSQPKRVARSSRFPKSDDSSDDAEGVGPRRPDLIAEDETETKKPRAVDITRCFFFEYDEDGRKRKDVPRVCIDVMSILLIPEGNIEFNQRSLNKAIVAGLDALIDRSTAQRGVDDDAPWEPSELILAPITPCANDPNVQGTRVLPEDFDWRRAKEYFYYPVAGQHTAEAMKRARYMMRLFNYIVFKSENREKDDCNQEFFFDYKGMTERYGVTAEAWDEERDKIPLEYVRKVPKRLGGDQEIKGLKGAGLKATEALYKDASFHFKVFVYRAIGKVDLLTAEMWRLSNAALHLLWEGKGRRTTLLPINMHPKELLPAQDEVVTAATNLNCKATILDLALPSHCSSWSSEDFDALYKMMSKLCGKNWTLIVFASQKHHKTVMRHLYNRENVEVIPGTWKRFMGVGTTVDKYGNMQIESKDTMTIVLHAKVGDLGKVTRVSRSEADIVEVNVVEQFFKRCAAKHGGDEGSEKEDSFLHEDEGVIVLGKPHAGLVWKILRAGNHVFACDASSTDIAYLTKAIEILAKDPRNDCTIEKHKSTQRSDRDMYHKLGKKREKMWEYLFQGDPKTAFQHKYIYRKAMTQEAYGGYHKAEVGAFALFIARCEEMKFMRHCNKLTYSDYSDVARRTDAWNPIDNDEETETSDLEIDLRVKRSRDGAHGREGVQNVPDGSVQNENPEGGLQQSGPLSTQVVNTQDRASSAGEFPRDSPTPVQAVINTLLHGNRYGYQGEKRSIGRMSGGMRMNDVQKDADEDDLVVPGVFPKLTPGHDIPESFMQGPTSPYVFHDVGEETSSAKWGHHILWHPDVFEPCIDEGKWAMALHLRDGWKVKPRMAEDSWLKTTNGEILLRVTKENHGADEALICAKAQSLFESLRSNNRLEYKHQFYDFPSSRSYNKIDWKIVQPPTCHGLDNIPVGCSQLAAMSQTNFALSAEEALSQTRVAANYTEKGNTLLQGNGKWTITGVKGAPTSHAVEQKSNVASYGPPLVTQLGNEGASQMESPTPSAEDVVAKAMQPGVCTELAAEAKENSDEMIKLLNDVEREEKNKLERSNASANVINCISESEEGQVAHAEGDAGCEDVGEDNKEWNEGDEGERLVRRSTREKAKTQRMNI